MHNSYLHLRNTMSRRRVDYDALLNWAQRRGFLSYDSKTNRYKISGSSRTINRNTAQRAAAYLKKNGPAATYEMYGQESAMEQRVRQYPKRKGPRTAVVVKKGRVPLLKRLKTKAAAINKRRRGEVPEGVDIRFNKRQHNTKVLDVATVPIRIQANEENFPEAVDNFNVLVDTRVYDTVNAMWRNAGGMYRGHSVAARIHFTGGSNYNPVQDVKEDGMTIGVMAHMLDKRQMDHFYQELKNKAEIGFRETMKYMIDHVTCEYVELGFITTDQPTAYDQARGVMRD